MKVGVVGIGIMGEAMVRNLLKAGMDVGVYNRSQDKLTALKKLGAKVYSKPSELAANSDVIIEITANDESSKAVWLGDEGILSGAESESILIVAATVSANWIDELAEICKKQGHKLLDMPVTGGRVGANAGELMLLFGGDAALIDNLKPVTDAIGSKVYNFGKVGNGTRYKLILNSLQAIHIVGFKEMMKVASVVGLDLDQVGQALAIKPGGVVTEFTWRDYFDQPDPINFSTNWMAKDVAYTEKMAGKGSSSLLDQVHKLYQQALDEGRGESDFTSVIISEKK